MTVAELRASADVGDVLLEAADAEVGKEDSSLATHEVWEYSEPVSAELILASRDGDVDMVERLLSTPGIEVNAVASHEGDEDLHIYEPVDDMTALIFASVHGHADVVERLLGAPGIDVNMEDADGGTALMWASGNGHTDVVERLLGASSIEVNQEDKVVNAAVETQGLAPSMSLRKIRWSVQLRTR